MDINESLLENNLRSLGSGKTTYIHFSAVMNGLCDRNFKSRSLKTLGEFFFLVQASIVSIDDIFSLSKEDFDTLHSPGGFQLLKDWHYSVDEMINLDRTAKHALQGSYLANLSLNGMLDRSMLDKYTGKGWQ